MYDSMFILCFTSYDSWKGYTFADCAFCCTATTVWNSLSNDVVSSTSLTVFKSTLNTFLFRQTLSLVSCHDRNLSFSASGVFDMLALYKVDYYYYYY